MENRTRNTSDLIPRIIRSRTEEYIEEEFSSSDMSPVYFSNDSKGEDGSYSPFWESSSHSYKSISVSNLDRLVVRRNMVNEEVERDRIVKLLVQELQMALDLFSDENEEYSSAERVIIEIEHKYKMRVLGEVIQTIYLKYFNNPSYMIGICRSLLRYDLSEVKPWGATMLAGLLNHPDERVTEYTIQLIDNWSDVELLPLLNTIRVSSVWLRDYIKDVVKSLETENVLYKKVI